MASGPLYLVEEEVEKRKALYLLTDRYSKTVPFARHEAEVEGSINRTMVLRLDIQSLSGKESKERMQERTVSQKSSQ